MSYYRRIFQAYRDGKNSQLAFWHDEPRMNRNFCVDHLGPYYMDFFEKAAYRLHLDGEGIPLLDYKGRIGKQYNPIAVAQYGLGHYNLFLQTRNEHHRIMFLKAADWLVNHLEINDYGVPVWMHHFHWEYKKDLKDPWYSGLAQGQGLSVLIRAFAETGQQRYAQTAVLVYQSFEKDIHEGGVIYRDNSGDPWIEEYILFPPTHILNGFIWGLWGVYDFFLMTKQENIIKIWWECIETLKTNLRSFDMGYWSLYDLVPYRIKNIASCFYHRLHIVQLEILYKLSGEPLFQHMASHWQEALQHRSCRARALGQKVVFKLVHY